MREKPKVMRRHIRGTAALLLTCLWLVFPAHASTVPVLAHQPAAAPLRTGHDRFMQLQVDHWVRGNNLSATQEAGFGSSVAVSGDGTTALIGAPDLNSDTGISVAGAAFVFIRSGTTWSLQQKLTAPVPSVAVFGISVSLSSDGSTALIGAPGEASSTGAAYVFIRSGTSWTLQRKLRAQDGRANDQFGNSVSLSGDGNTALVGAYDKTISTGLDTAGAAYVFTRDVTTAAWSEQAELTAGDAAAGDNFGSSVSLSSDGRTALAGAPSKTISTTATFAGAAYVFVRGGTRWSQEKELSPHGAASDDEFGASVSLAGNGNTALVGAPGAVNQTGAAYVFTRSVSTWSEQTKLTAGDAAAGDVFGISVSLSGDASTALIGADEKTSSPGAQLAGVAYVFILSGTSWSLQKELISSDSAGGDAFGNTVSLSSDGSTALVGAREKTSDTGVDGVGAAYVFVRTGTAWAQQKELIWNDAQSGDAFGSSVSLNADGSFALVGAPGTVSDTGAFSAGAAYIFDNQGTWTQLQRLTPTTSPGANDGLGRSVSLSADGKTALVGEPGNSGDLGAAYVFVSNGTTWSQQAKLTATDETAGDFFGLSVSLSDDGNTALIGADNAASATGAAYVFVRNGTSWSPQAKLTASDGAASDSFGNSVSLSGDGNTALVGAFEKASATGASHAGAAYVFTRSGTSWSLQKELTAGDPAAGAVFGFSVSLSDDGNTALIGARGKSTSTGIVGAGAAYVFVRSGTSWSQQKELTASNAAADDFFGGSVSLSDDGDSAIIGATIGNQEGAAYAFTRSGTSWSERQELTATNPAAGDLFGHVALSGDGGSALAGAPGTLNHTGVAYTFFQPPAATLSLSGAPSSTTSSTSFSLTVTAGDASNAQAYYLGTVHFTSADPQAVLPADYTFTSGDDGSHTFTVTLNTPTRQSITVTDTVKSTLTATTADINVTPLQTTPIQTKDWYLIGGSPLTLWPGASPVFSWNALTGTWFTPSGTEPPGTGTWEFVPTQTSNFIFVQRCARAVTITVQLYRWNMIGNPCVTTVTLPPGARALLWDNAHLQYIPTTTIPPGFGAWVLPTSTPLALAPS